ncbi:MAG: hypothetical protein PF542_04945 [Nanoarchaeota archaeon]|jgi:hypothetical protein|nr:hypothetical protein [Nanoarchaeota archaeon]
MAELTVSQLIKLIIGSLVVVAVVAGAYMIFKDNIFDFINTVPTGPAEMFRSILRW